MSAAYSSLGESARSATWRRGTTSRCDAVNGKRFRQTNACGCTTSTRSSRSALGSLRRAHRKCTPPALLPRMYSIRHGAQSGVGHRARTQPPVACKTPAAARLSSERPPAASLRSGRELARRRPSGRPWPRPPSRPPPSAPCFVLRPCLLAELLLDELADRGRLAAVVAACASWEPPTGCFWSCGADAASPMRIDSVRRRSCESMLAISALTGRRSRRDRPHRLRPSSRRARSTG